MRRESEPWLTPMRSAVPRRLHISTRRSNCPGVVAEITRVDTHLVDRLGRYHRHVGREVYVGHYGRRIAVGAHRRGYVCQRPPLARALSRETHYRRAGIGYALDLRHGGRDIGRRRVGHRLYGYRMIRADRAASYRDTVGVPPAKAVEIYHIVQSFMNIRFFIQRPRNRPAERDERQCGQQRPDTGSGRRGEHLPPARVGRNERVVRPVPYAHLCHDLHDKCREHVCEEGIGAEYTEDVPYPARAFVAVGQPGYPIPQHRRYAAGVERVRGRPYGFVYRNRAVERQRRDYRRTSPRGHAQAAVAAAGHTHRSKISEHYVYRGGHRPRQTFGVECHPRTRGVAIAVI